jgi:dihydrolipoamide dehydrogenase
MSKKIIVVGGGPGGYAAAIRGAQLGAEVGLAEAAQLGGTCLNRGCVPTKVLLHSAEFFHKAVRGSVAGVKLAGVELDWPGAQARKDEVVGRLTGGVAALLRHHGVTLYRETAELIPGKTVRAGSEILAPDAVILAMGSVNARLDFPGRDLPDVLDSASALALEAAPKSVAIVGGGVIGMEFAVLYHMLGAEVCVIEALPEILPAADEEIAGCLREMMEAEGVRIYTGARVTAAEETAGGLSVSFERGGVVQRILAKKLLVAAGRRPNTAGSGLEAAGVATERGAVVTDAYFQTSVPGVYAVGDCNGQMMLAHAAIAQGAAAAEHIMGETPHYNSKVVPSCVYTQPEIAGVGMTEGQVRQAGIPYKIGRFDLSGNAKALIENKGGIVKIIADARLGEVLGVHMIGPRVTELIAEAALCVSMEGTAEEIANTVHAHPTVSEAVGEAAMSVFGKPIHGV